MQSYLLTIAYDGSAYAGWQRQDGFNTIQAEVEHALQVLLAEPIVVHGAGRTDAGVHALAQCAHVRLPVAWDPLRLRAAINGNLATDIAVRAVRPVPARFHARFSACGKRYLYRFAVDEVRPVFGAGYAHWVRRPLDLAAMRLAAALLRGQHDFAAFAANPGYTRKRGTVRRIHHLHLMRRPHGLDLVVQGDGFLYNMVRSIAGTLREVGLGRCSADDVAAVLAAKDRRRAGPTIDAGGLYLAAVLYPPAAFEEA